MKYDCIVIGGGIGGLYVAYRFLKRFSGSRVLIIERGSSLGGRVFTYKDDLMTVDAGAGRFSEQHSVFIRLLKELGLYGKKRKNGNSVAHAYIDPKGERHIMNSILDYDVVMGMKGMKGSKGSKEPFDIVLDGTLDMLNKSSLPNVGLVARVLAVGYVTPKDKLIGMTFFDFAKTVLTSQEVDFLAGSFGYYSELVLMNAYDCMNLMLELDPRHTFYSLGGGLSQVIDELEKRIRAMNGVFLMGREVERIRDLGTSDDSSFSSFAVSGVGPRGGDFEVFGKRVVCAVTKKDLARFSIFRPIMGMVSGILCAPLCRIYAKYPVEEVSSKEVSSKGVWFKGMPKYTVNNELRMIIPISEESGIIMIAYMDNKFAEYWKKIWNRGGEAAVNRRLKTLVFDALGKEIPDAEEIRVFFWPCGVGYWGVGADSEVVSRDIIRPLGDKEIYVCGENFSCKYQQWMEGALETGDRVLSQMRST